MVLECADLDGPPGNALDHAGVLLWTYNNYVADLERAIRVERDPGKEISQSILQSETDDDTKNGGRGKQGPKINLGVNVIEGQNEQDSEGHQRKDISNQGGCFIA